MEDNRVNMKQKIKTFVKKCIPQSILRFCIHHYRRWYWLNKLPKELSKRRTLLRFNIHLVEHCNLQCSGCEHFSPLAPKQFLDIAIFERDCARLSGLTGGKIEVLEILGGEPLLNPQIVAFIDLARKYFPVGNIKILTNGILLTKQQSNFWESCQKNNVEVHVSLYPVNTDRAAIAALAEKYKVYITWDYVDRVEWVRRPLDLDGKQDAIYAAHHCYQLNQCIQLVDGKLYTCARIAYIKYFNDYFGKNIEVSERDYIDIYKAKNIDEIFDFLCSPVPFCRYCDIKHTIWDIGWSTSKKDISEWISRRR
jgi:MoaA/NifB/PqqE/SkfB family radical SAM enzyme